MRHIVYRSHLLWSACLVGCFGLGIALPALATNYTVSTTDDEADSSPSCTTGSSTDCSLREAIRASNSNSGSDTITIPAGTYRLSLTGANEDSAATGDLDVTDTTGTLTITGAGSTTTLIDGNSANNSTDDRVFDIASSADLTMTDVTVKGGTIDGAAGRGAGIRINGSSTIALSDIIISGNTFTNTDSFTFSNGAGLYCTGTTTLTLTDSTISDNGSSTEDIDGGGAYIDINCDADFDTVTIDGNAGKQRGGGLHILPSTSLTKTFTNLTVSNNTGNVGGGIFMIGSSTSDIPIVLTNSTINANTALSYGGGIELLANTHATNLTVTNNTTVGHGGGIFIYNETYVDVIVAFSTIVNNTANSDGSGGDDGGGI
ncbi:MAG: Polymorphic outer membrane protein, partial [Candidatus Giovannonibacteria bacterium GW2011_GWA2_53_7]